jgi:hypothetical protein
MKKPSSLGGGLLLHLRTTGGTGEAKLARDAQTLQTHGRDQSLATYLVIPAEAGIQGSRGGAPIKGMIHHDSTEHPVTPQQCTSV